MAKEQESEKWITVFHIYSTIYKDDSEQYVFMSEVTSLGKVLVYQRAFSSLEEAVFERHQMAELYAKILAMELKFALPQEFDVKKHILMIKLRTKRKGAAL